MLALSEALRTHLPKGKFPPALPRQRCSPTIRAQRRQVEDLLADKPGCGRFCSTSTGKRGSARSGRPGWVRLSFLRPIRVRQIHRSTRTFRLYSLRRPCPAPTACSRCLTCFAAIAARSRARGWLRNLASRCARSTATWRACANAAPRSMARPALAMCSNPASCCRRLMFSARRDRGAGARLALRRQPGRSRDRASRRPRPRQNPGRSSPRPRRIEADTSGLVVAPAAPPPTSRRLRPLPSCARRSGASAR